MCHKTQNILNSPDDRLVVTATYQYLTEIMKKSDLNFLSKKSKQLFNAHLKSNSSLNKNQNMLYISALLEFKAALNANTPGEIPILAYEYLQAMPLSTRENAPFGFSDSTQRKLRLLGNI